jgi:hypothetical protein
VVPVVVVSSGEVLWVAVLLALHPATSAVKNAARTANFLIALLREALCYRRLNLLWPQQIIVYSPSCREKLSDK